MILLPLLALFAWTLGFRRAGRDRLSALAAALVIVGVAVSVGTEWQSFAGELTAPASACLWILVAAAGFVTALRRNPLVTAGADGRRPVVEEWLPVALLLTLTAIVALVAAPNSYDALTYHLTRVARWIQQGSVAPFATYDTRQLFMPSWSEYAILQFQLLSGGDHFANLVQWLAFGGSCAGAALLASALGGSRISAWLAAAMVATLPMAVAQASGTQTDVTAACWAVLAAAFGYRLLAPDCRRGDGVWCALSLALALATKQTAFLFAGIALVPVAVMLVRRRTIGQCVRLLAVLVVAMVVVAGPQLLRNRQVFGHWQGDAAWVDDAAMRTAAPNQVAGNVVRNLALHLGTPWSSVNDAVVAAASGLSRMVGANPDDPRTTWNPRFVATPWNTHEESAPNPLHLLVILGCIVALARMRLTAVQRWFPLVLVVGFVAFCAALKWQSYNSRLQTPWFVLSLAWSAVLIERMPRVWRRGLLVVLVVAALPVALVNYTRPLIALPGGAIAPRPSIVRIPRELGYFMYDPALARPYLDVSRRIAASDCTDVGMHTWPDAWEYAVMAVVHDARRDVRFRPIGVTNASARFEVASAAPCLLLQIWPAPATPPAWAAGWHLIVAWQGPHNQPGIALFAPDSTSAITAPH